MRKKLEDFYLEYVNNYLTTAVMAEHYNLSIEQCSDLILIGKEIHYQNKGIEIVERKYNQVNN